MSEYEPLKIAIPAACLEHWQKILEGALSPKVQFRAGDNGQMGLDAYESRGQAIKAVISHIKSFHTPTKPQP